MLPRTLWGISIFVVATITLILYSAFVKEKQRIVELAADHNSGNVCASSLVSSGIPVQSLPNLKPSLAVHSTALEESDDGSRARDPSQRADFLGYSEDARKSRGNNAHRIDDSYSTKANFVGIDYSDVYENWEKSSNDHILGLSASGADEIDQYGASANYDGWVPPERLNSGAADALGYESFR